MYIVFNTSSEVLNTYDSTEEMESAITADLETNRYDISDFRVFFGKEYIVSTRVTRIYELLER